MAKTIEYYDSQSDLFTSDPRWLAIKDKICVGLPNGEGYTLDNVLNRVHSFATPEELEAWMEMK